MVTGWTACMSWDKRAGQTGGRMVDQSELKKQQPVSSQGKKRSLTYPHRGLGGMHTAGGVWAL